MEYRNVCQCGITERTDKNGNIRYRMFHMSSITGETKSPWCRTKPQAIQWLKDYYTC